MDFTVDSMSPKDWEQVRAIYLEGVATGNATFEISAPDWEGWHSSHLLECRVIARLQDLVVGWAALSSVSSRCVYSGVAEVSVYVSESFRGQGFGQALLKELIRRSEQLGIWTLQAGIFPENQASLNLHFTNGFREVGRRERLGKLGGVWRDVLLLERRSRVAGAD
jgi:L-amino acid N-acyltransferase YncA